MPVFSRQGRRLVTKAYLLRNIVILTSHKYNARPKVLYFSGSDANLAQGLKYYNVANFALTSDRPPGSISKYIIFNLFYFI